MKRRNGLLRKSRDRKASLSRSSVDMKSGNSPVSKHDRTYRNSKDLWRKHLFLGAI
jgi:hypothetical protein